METDVVLSNSSPKSDDSSLGLTFTVDSFANGIAFGAHRVDEEVDPREQYRLRMKDDSEVVRLRSRYMLHKNNPLAELESQLMKLSRQGILRHSSIYLGTTTDPFYPFEGKFDASIKFLELFQKYTPGMLYVQTRSPLIVIALPVFKRLGKHCAITMGIETSSEKAAKRYTPGLPRIEERLKSARALRRFGIEVNVQVSPLLPYGDWKKDATAFAWLLSENADHVYVKPIFDGSSSRGQLRASTLARKLAADREFHWLRADSANPLITSLEKICPEKLDLPVREHLKNAQVEMFAA